MRFGPPLDRAPGALILLHGRGSSAEDIAPLLEELDAAGYAGLAPSAPGGSWYPRRFLAPVTENEPWLGAALATVEALVREVLAAGLPAQRVGLIGFSQGACLALEQAVRAPRRYGFVAALSGALIGPLDTERPAVDLQGLPVLLGCAADDPHIPRAHVERSATTLQECGAAVTRQLFSGSAHSVFPAELAWIDERLTAWRDPAAARGNGPHAPGPPGI